MKKKFLVSIELQKHGCMFKKITDAVGTQTEGKKCSHRFLKF